MAESSAHTFTASLHWEGGRDGAGQLQTAALRTAISVRAALSGPGQGTSPEELLLGAAAGCYAITLAGLLQRMRIPVASLHLLSEATVEAGGTLRVVRIVHRPRVTLGPGADVARARSAPALAEEHCMISRAIRGNVEVAVEPELIPG